jgi:8-oxo-dGTP pyrophosphatase MutT (NUDIX family)
MTDQHSADQHSADQHSADQQSTDRTDGGPRLLARILADHRPSTEAEAADTARVRALVELGADPWSRALPLHVTASAVVVHPATRRVLLRWHARQGGWLHVGGHGDPGETDPVAVAVREAVEETGLDDVRPWPDAALLHLAVVGVPASATEPAHEHADLRFVLATDAPAAARPENEGAALRWEALAEAAELTTSRSLRETFGRLAPLLG